MTQAKKTGGSALARRTAARLAAVQALYQMKLNNQDAAAVLRDFSDHPLRSGAEGDDYVPADAELLTAIVEGAARRAEDVDRILAGALKDGGRSKVEPLLSCILCAGIFELIGHADIDAGIIINDYLNVTAGFYDGGEAKLVNAILDRTGKAVRG